MIEFVENAPEKRKAGRPKGSTKKKEEKAPKYIKVYVPSIQEEIPFKFDWNEKSESYEFAFGHSLLQLYDVEKAQRRARHYRSKALRKQDELQTVTSHSDSLNITTYVPPSFTDIENDHPELNVVFETNSWFVKQVLEKWRPKEVKEPGFIYIYRRKEDMNMLENKIITQILLHKIGRTKNEP